MLNPKILRTELDEVARQLGRRALTIDKDWFVTRERRRKQLQTDAESLRNQRNTNSKRIAQGKSSGEDISNLMDEMKTVNAELEAGEAELEQLQSEIHAWMLTLPNLPHESVPDGDTEADNAVVRTWGECPEFDFPALGHVEIGERTGGLDFAKSATITGSRFVTMQDQVARLHRALIQFMLDVHVSEHGYREVYVPYIANDESLTCTGQLPKFEEDLFKLATGSPYYLIPTAEVPVTNLWRDHIAKESELPVKYVCHTPCFRSEAGSYGKDTRGMIRQHQFEKVELVQLVKPEASWRALEELTQHAEIILQKLGLHYRVVTLCTGDLGFAASKTYDIEVWLPGEGRYREISSCSNFVDFQARRLKARWKNPATGKTELLHTLNGSGLAAGRTLVAILENYQDDQARIRVPDVLQPYMGGLEIIASQ
ncbi:MAG: serine--tRNA ligase [Proteobacteria bacterium]|nr:serine--tRNA ligase [Pseudomonadota bacterium]